MGTIAIFGAGVMGETLLSGLIRSGRPADGLIITERRPERAAELTERYGVRAVENTEAADAAAQGALV
jgi:pyrroline-5-carboxylate reductase